MSTASAIGLSCWATAWLFFSHSFHFSSPRLLGLVLVGGSKQARDYQWIQLLPPFTLPPLLLLVEHCAKSLPEEAI